MQPAAGENFDILESINIVLPLKYMFFKGKQSGEIPKIFDLRPDPETPEKTPDIRGFLKTLDN